jgi:hypothetical protein
MRNERLNTDWHRLNRLEAMLIPSSLTQRQNDEQKVNDRGRSKFPSGMPDKSGTADGG